MLVLDKLFNYKYSVLSSSANPIWSCYPKPSIVNVLLLI